MTTKTMIDGDALHEVAAELNELSGTASLVADATCNGIEVGNVIVTLCLLERRLYQLSQALYALTDEAEPAADCEPAAAA